MYQLGVPVVADSLVTIGLVPKGLAMKTFPPDWIATDGRPNPYLPVRVGDGGQNGAGRLVDVGRRIAPGIGHPDVAVRHGDPVRRVQTLARR